MRIGFQDNVFLEVYAQVSTGEDYIPDASPTLIDSFPGHYVDVSPSPEKLAISPEMQAKSHRVFIHGSNVTDRGALFSSKCAVKVTKVLDPDILVWRDVTSEEAARYQFTIEKAVLGARGTQKIILTLKTGSVA